MKLLRLVLFLSIFTLIATSTGFSQRLTLDDGVHLTPPPTATPIGTPSAFVNPQPVRQMLPVPVKLAILAGAFVIGAGALIFASRAWRSGNLFDRQYRFPPVANVALRLGANKSGGCMATIAFDDATDSV